MAFCTQCQIEIGTMDTSCSDCGFDFSKRGGRFRESASAPNDLPIGDVVLMIGTVSTGMAALASGLYSIELVAQNEWFSAALFGPCIWAIAAAMIVVFVRSSSR